MLKLRGCPPDRHPPPAAILMEHSPWPPRAARAAAVSLPMPLVGPVTTTTRPSAGPPMRLSSGSPLIHSFCGDQESNVVIAGSASQAAQGVRARQ